MEKHDGWVRYTKLNHKQDRISDISMYLGTKIKDDNHSPLEQAEEMLKVYPDDIYECVANGRKHHNGDFFIEVLFKSDRSVNDHQSKLCVARSSCPDAFYDQACYKYTKYGDKLETLWVITSLAKANKFRSGVFDIGIDDYDLCEYVKAMDDGSLAVKTYLFNNPEKRIISGGS